ncbi:DinB family protein [Paenibacillus sp. R14(2021)]|uniref:DinB family protein n=1 Tax=Paenibacillus sp. R14(2021) TaxID=2859228 RepID=UPI001C611B67|nr:DUF1572 family protein [Paenibacillus sp. R14(2021)]
MKYVEEIMSTMNTELDRILSCLDLLSEEQIWCKFKPAMNAVGNLCIHLAGNEYQHVISGIGRMPNIRQRTSEFTSDRTYTRDELKALLTRTRNESSGILNRLTEDELSQPVRIHYSIDDWNTMKDRSPNEAEEAGYTRDIQTILHQVSEHYGYHTGQIILLTKLLIDTDKSLSGYTH